MNAFELNRYRETLREKYCRANAAERYYARRDIRETLAHWRDADTPYTRKLWAEWDYLLEMEDEKRP